MGYGVASCSLDSIQRRELSVFSDLAIDGQFLRDHGECESTPTTNMYVDYLS